MEITAKMIGSIIAQHINNNLGNTFTIEYSENQIEVIYDGQWYKNKALFTTTCGEQRMFTYAFHMQKKEWMETSDMRCNRFIENPVFWAGYVCGGLMERHSFD